MDAHTRNFKDVIFSGLKGLRDSKAINHSQFIRIYADVEKSINSNNWVEGEPYDNGYSGVCPDCKSDGFWMKTNRLGIISCNCGHVKEMI
jgi:hypothetical protein